MQASGFIEDSHGQDRTGGRCDYERGLCGGTIRDDADDPYSADDLCGKCSEDDDEHECVTIQRNGVCRRRCCRYVPELEDSSDDEDEPAATTTTDDHDDEDDGDPHDGVSLRDQVEEARRDLKEFVDSLRQPLNHSSIHAVIDLDPDDAESTHATGMVDHEESQKILYVPEEMKIFIALDSGAVDHCANLRDLPNDVRVINDQPRRKFVNASGDDIDYWGQAQVRLQKNDGKHIGSSFQVMDVCRPLHSTSKICDQGCNVVYTDKEAVVVPKGLLDKFLASVQRLATYPRAGGLYVAEMTVRAKPDPKSDPAAGSPFGGQGQQR